MHHALLRRGLDFPSLHAVLVGLRLHLDRGVPLVRGVDLGVDEGFQTAGSELRSAFSAAEFTSVPVVVGAVPDQPDEVLVREHEHVLAGHQADDRGGPGLGVTSGLRGLLRLRRLRVPLDGLLLVALVRGADAGVDELLLRLGGGTEGGQRGLLHPGAGGLLPEGVDEVPVAHHEHLGGRREADRGGGALLGLTLEPGLGGVPDLVFLVPCVGRVDAGADEGRGRVRAGLVRGERVGLDLRLAGRTLPDLEHEVEVGEDDQVLTGDDAEHRGRLDLLLGGRLGQLLRLRLFLVVDHVDDLAHVARGVEGGVRRRRGERSGQDRRHRDRDSASPEGRQRALPT